MLVNNELVDEAMIRDEARAIRPRLYEAMTGENAAAIEARVREWSRENVIERVLLRQAAMADSEPLPPGAIEEALAKLQSAAPGESGCRTGVGDDGHRKQVERQLRIDRLMERVTAHLSPPRHKDVTDYYRKHRESFGAPERVHAAHIVKNVDENTAEDQARAAIEEVERQLRGGASFEELADRFSDCPGRGGDLGVFPRGEMVPEFDAVVFALAPGHTSGIFRTQFGFHIAKVHQKWPEGIRELSEVREELEQLLFNEKKQRAIEQYLDRLRAKAEVRE